MNPIDYGRSYTIGIHAANEVRFWVESRTRIIDTRSGTETDFVQAASCKSENTFAEKDLFMRDNYDFLPIFGPEHAVIFRRRAWGNDTYREYRNAEDLFGGLDDRFVEARVELLPDAAAALQTTYDNIPLIAQTEIWNEETGLRAIMEYPVKTMNTIRATNTYQVDTGPLAYPDLSQQSERLIECLSLAFVAFNVPDFADFVIEALTPIDEKGVGGQELCRVHHYSKIVNHDAENRLFAQQL